VECRRGAILLEDASISGGTLTPHGLVLNNVVIDALISTGAHVPPGQTVTQTVPSLARAGNQMLQEPDFSGKVHADSRSVAKWLAAMTLIGVGQALNLMLTFFFVVVAFWALGLPFQGTVFGTVLYVIYQAQLWQASIVVLALALPEIFIRPALLPLYFVTIRRMVVPVARDGDAAPHTIGSIFLEQALRNDAVKHAATICGLAGRPSLVTRAFGMQVAADAFVPMPRLDRPELVTVGKGAYTGGDNSLCSRQITSAGAVYKRVDLGHFSLVANGSVLEPGTIFGPFATLGNRSVAFANVDYVGTMGSAGVWMGVVPRSPSLPRSTAAARLPTSQMSPNLLFRRPSVASAVHPLPTLPLTLLPPLKVVLLEVLFKGVLPALSVWATVGAVRYSRAVVPAVWFVLPWLQMAVVVAAAKLWKKGLVGEFEEAHPAPLFSSQAQARDLVVFVLMAVDDILEVVKGTHLYNVIQCSFGARFGNVFYLGQQCPEPEMLTIGEGTLIAPGVDFFSHNIENFSFSFEPIVIHAHCVVGERASVMGHTTMQSGSQLLPLAQMMKGTTFLAMHTYDGNPADTITAQEDTIATPAGTTEHDVDLALEDLDIEKGQLAHALFEC